MGDPSLRLKSGNAQCDAGKTSSNRATNNSPERSPSLTDWTRLVAKSAVRAKKSRATSARLLMKNLP
jgi:hypothetical protein